MKVMMKGVLPDGTQVQLEEWGVDDIHLMIAAYPIAQRTRSCWQRGGERFRLQISENQYTGYTNEMVEADYFALLSGKKSLCDLAERFWNGERDKWGLGMETKQRP